MSELTTIPAAELAELKERLNGLAREKAQLQLVALLMNRLGALPGLEKAVEGMLQFVMDILGGRNVTIFYRLDEAFHSVDVHGRTAVGGEIEDDLARQVFETREFVAREREFSQTGLITKEFTKATTWVMPLLVGTELVGVLRIDDLLVADRELRDEVQTFLRYASLVLKNEISGETRLRRAFDEVSRANRELELRVAERTSELRAANEQLLLELAERARAEDALYEAQQVFRTLVENSPDVIARYDRDCRRTYVNPTYLEVAQIPQQELLATAPMQRSPLPPASATVLENLLRRVLDSGVAETADIVWPKAGNVDFWYNVYAFPESDRNGRIASVMTVSRDITKRKRAEAELGRVNRALRMLSDTNQALIRIRDEATLLNEVCRIAVDVGSSRLAWVGLVEHDEAKTLRPVASAGADAGYVESAKLTWADTERGRGPGGTSVRSGQPCIFRSLPTDPVFAPWREAAIQRGYRSIASLPLMCEGQTLGALLIYAGEEDAFDSEEVQILKQLAGDLAFGITALRTRAMRDHAQEALQRSESSLKEAQRIAHLGNWELDLERKALTWSDEVFRIFEIDRDRFGASYEAFLDTVHPDERAAVDRAYTESVKTKTPYDIVHRLLMADGRVKYVNERCETFYDESGQPLRSLGTVQDVTERTRAEDALRQSERRTSTLNGIANVFLTMPDEEMYGGVLAIVLELMESRFGVFGFISENGDLVIPSMTRDVGAECEVPGKPITFPRSTWGESAWGRAITEQRAVSTDGPFRLPAGHVQIHSFLAVPIVFGDVSIGLVSVANKERGYAAHDQELLESVVRFIAPVLNARLQRDRQERERNQAEEALRASERRYREVFEHSSECIFLLDVTSEGRFKFAGFNPAQERAMGYSNADVAEKFVEEAISEAFAAQVTTNYRRCVETGTPIAYDEELDLPVGRRHFETVLIPVRNSAGHVYRIVGVARDVTARKRLEVELRRLAAAIDQAAETIVVTDPEGVIQYVNPAFSRVTGYSREEAIGQNPRILKGGTHPPEFYGGMWATLARGEVWHGHFVNRRKDGGLFEEDATISPVRDEGGRVVNYVAVKRDVTQEVALENELRQSQKMEAVGRLAGGVAHDFNNLVAVILGYTDSLLKKTHADDPQRAHLHQIAKAADRAAGLTRQLLAFSRRQVLEPTILDLGALVRDLDKMLSRLLGEDVDLRISSAPQLGKVRADAGQIEQVIVNLAVNARDAMPGGGLLTIETTNVELDEDYAQHHEGAKAGPFVMLAVSDSGCGMTPETQRRIFEPFFTTKELGKGTGLGLSTVYGVLKQSNGYIWVYSEVGHGTTFKIYLPRVDDVADATTSRQVDDAAVRGSETVLLVEDDAALRQLAQEVLEEAGYTVLAAAGGAEALTIAGEHRGPVDLLLTDVVMPGMSGPDLARRLTDRRPKAKVLFMSGYTDDAIAHHGVLSPGSLLLAKPFTRATLARKVREALGIAAPQ